jgi:hypothetical protein
VPKATKAINDSEGERERHSGMIGNSSSERTRRGALIMHEMFVFFKLRGGD